MNMLKSLPLSTGNKFLGTTLYHWSAKVPKVQLWSPTNEILSQHNKGPMFHRIKLYSYSLNHWLKMFATVHTIV